MDEQLRVEAEFKAMVRKSADGRSGWTAPAGGVPPVGGGGGDGDVSAQ